ncbi:MAG: hypothetical protein VYD19_10435 [Myxococcota bacterium]|nr:hypothetical protein [Myxococcota bacterium]
MKRYGLLFFSLLLASCDSGSEATQRSPITAQDHAVRDDQTAAADRDQGVRDLGTDPGLDLSPAPDLGPPVSRPSACGEVAVGEFGAAGGQLEVESGALIGATVHIPAGLLNTPHRVEMSCTQGSLVDANHEALGPILQLTFDPPLSREGTLKVKLVYSAADAPDSLLSDHIRLFWAPDNRPYTATPPLLNPTFALRAGEVEFTLPRPGGMQLGFSPTRLESQRRRFTWQATLGISMGAVGAAGLAFDLADEFDAVIALGGPTDWPYLLDYIRRRLFGGFCPTPREGEWCPLPAPKEPMEHASDFINWRYSTSGADFHRNQYFKFFHDVSYAFGNPFMYSETSPFLPPGFPPEELERRARARCAPECRGEDCEEVQSWPRIEGFYDDEYNPEGLHPVIPFCDGSEDDQGVFYPDVYHKQPVNIALAVDLNDNGRRDLHEPVLRNLYEPFEDVGCDQRPSSEEEGYDPILNPDPSGDDYHWFYRPEGTEGNTLFDLCDGEGAGSEPYQDVGLDGVPMTSQLADGGYDWGEGNERFDYNPNFKRFIDDNPGHRFAALDSETRARLKFWLDGGIRDVLNLQVCGMHFAGRIQATGENLRIYDGFPTLTGTPLGPFLPKRENLDLFDEQGARRMVRYGDPSADEAALAVGDGDHVGSEVQALLRFITSVQWLLRSWPEGDYSPVPIGLQGRQERILVPFGEEGRLAYAELTLPPGYDLPEASERRYPVIYFFHGYGQDPSYLGAIGQIFGSFMMRSLWPKALFVFLDGTCGGKRQTQCNDGIDNDGDGYADHQRARRCERDSDCASGDYCAEIGEDSLCCPPAPAPCLPPDNGCEDEGDRSEGEEEISLCEDGVDNDLDGLSDLLDPGCSAPRSDEENECITGSFYRDHVAELGGRPGGPQVAAGLRAVVDYIKTNYRVREPETREGIFR